ncbi:MAG TPA: hypothetical protein VFE58_13610 [Tepidisphaeraceae bacterium]|jgi:hypothetical protein|nr:hypothetical protein [Tepidisphaeraceae bacterium]
MRYITATFGAIFIFVALFLLTCVAVALLPPIFRTPVDLGLFQTNNVIGLALSFFAASASFRATLRRARAKNLKAA